jgi:hypothetical protein
MARLSEMSLRLSFAVVAAVLIFALESDSRIKPITGSLGILRGLSARAPALDPTNDVAATPLLSSSYGKLPISFEANQGQAERRVRFLARGAGYNVFLSSSEVVLALHRSRGSRMRLQGFQPPTLRRTATGISENTVETAVVRMRLIGSTPSAPVQGMDRLPGTSNYLIGNYPRKWHVDVPTYAKVRFEGIYRGIDLVYYGNQEGRLEHDFVVAPGADPNQIEFDLREHDRAPGLKDGQLALLTKAGDVLLRAPVAYQVIGGERRRVQASYKTTGSGHIRFGVEPYDKQVPLVIDPVLVYSAVFGGDVSDYVQAMTIDTEGNVYVAGVTYSLDFPLVDPYQPSPSGSTNGLVFVSKLNSTGTALLYSTYLGGAGASANGIAVDHSRRIYISGETGGDFPVVNAYQPTFGGYSDAFIAVLSPNGEALEWSTYLGGVDADGATAMTLDTSDNVYVTGYTSGHFPALHSIHPPGTSGIWVAKFNRAGVLEYSSIFAKVGESAGGRQGSSYSIAADSNGSAYIVGYIFDASLPTTPGAFRATCSTFGGCPFVVKLSPDGESLVYSTRMGAAVASVIGIAVDSDLNAYIAGTTRPGLPVRSTGFQRTYGGGPWDGYVAKLNATGSNLIWSTYLGGSGDDEIQSLALDQHRQVYVSGFTSSPNFPVKAPVQSRVGGSSQTIDQTFVTTLSGSLDSIPYYSTYFGDPNSYYQLNLIAVDRALNVYLVLSCVS